MYPITCWLQSLEREYWTISNREDTSTLSLFLGGLRLSSGDLKTYLVTPTSATKIHVCVQRRFHCVVHGEIICQVTKGGGYSSQLDNEWTREQIQDIALFLESWQTVAPHLGLSTVEVEEVKKDGREEKVKRQKLPESWKTKFAFKAKYRMLIVALLKIGQTDQVQQVCHVLLSQHSKEGTYLWISLTS